MTHQELVTTRIQNGLRLIRESLSSPTSPVPPEGLPIAIALPLAFSIQDKDMDAAIAKVRADPQGAEALLVMAERYRPENAYKQPEFSLPSILDQNDISLVGIWLHAEATTAGNLADTIRPRHTI